MSLAHDPSTHLISPQFHIVHDDEFQTATKLDANTLLSNWKDVFITDHIADDENFETLIQERTSNNDVSIRVRLAHDVQNDENTINPAPSMSEGDNQNPDIYVSEGAEQEKISDAARQDSQGSKSDGSVA